MVIVWLWFQKRSGDLQPARLSQQAQLNKRASRGHLQRDHQVHHVHLLPYPCSDIQRVISFHRNPLNALMIAAVDKTNVHVG
jgi:hypothetical protein